MIKSYLFLDDDRARDPFAFTGAAAAQALTALCPAARGYRQTRASSEQFDVSASPAFAGVAELWFAEPAAALQAVAEPARFQPLWQADVRVAAVVTGEERVMLRLPAHHDGGGVKGVFPFCGRQDLSVADFQRAWLAHGPIAARTEGADYYLQCHPLPASYEPEAPRFDGVTELHWPTVELARAAMGSRQMREDQAGDAQRFLQPGTVMAFLAREETVLPP